MQRGVKFNFKFKKLHELEAKDEKILGCESGTQVDTSDRKNCRSKIWRCCPFKFRCYLIRAWEINKIIAMLDINIHCAMKKLTQTQARTRAWNYHTFVKYPYGAKSQ